MGGGGQDGSCDALKACGHNQNLCATPENPGRNNLLLGSGIYILSLFSLNMARGAQKNTHKSIQAIFRLMI